MTRHGRDRGRAHVRPSSSAVTGATAQTIQDTLEALRAGQVLDRTALYIDGTRVPSAGSGRIDVRNPATAWGPGAGAGADRSAAAAAAVAELPEQLGPILRGEAGGS